MDAFPILDLCRGDSTPTNELPLQGSEIMMGVDPGLRYAPTWTIKRRRLFGLKIVIVRSGLGVTKLWASLLYGIGRYVISFIFDNSNRISISLFVKKFKLISFVIIVFIINFTPLAIDASHKFFWNKFT